MVLKGQTVWASIIILMKLLLCNVSTKDLSPLITSLLGEANIFKEVQILTDRTLLNDEDIEALSGLMMKRPIKLRVMLNKEELQFGQNHGLLVIFHNIGKSSVQLILSKATQDALSSNCWIIYSDQKQALDFFIGSQKRFGINAMIIFAYRSHSGMQLTQILGTGTQQVLFEVISKLAKSCCCKINSSLCELLALEPANRVAKVAGQNRPHR